MKVYLSVDEKGVIQHYGVKGMKWGVRRQVQTDRRSGRKSLLETKKLDKKISKISSKIDKASVRGRDRKVQKLTGKVKKLEERKKQAKAEVQKSIKNIVKNNPQYKPSRVRDAVRRVLLGPNKGRYTFGDYLITVGTGGTGLGLAIARKKMRDRSYNKDEFDQHVIRELRKNGS